MKMRRCFVHMKMRREHPECRVSLLKIFHIIIQCLCRKLSFLCLCSHIVFISDLQNDFVKWLFLFTGCNLFLIVHYLPVFSLFCIVTDTNFFKQFMIHISNILIAVFHVQGTERSDHSFSKRRI